MFVACATAAGDHWPEFWRERADARTSALLDAAFAEFSNRSPHPDVLLYERAAPVLEKMLLDASRAVAVNPISPLTTGRAWMFLGELYCGQRKYSDCLAAERRGLDLIESEDADKIEVARTLRSHGNTLMLVSRYVEAEPLLHRALDIMEKTRGVGHLDTVPSLNSLGVLYEAKGEYAQALPIYKQSLAIRERALAPEHRHVAASLHNLASAYRSMGDCAQALPLFRRSLAIREGSGAKGTLDPEVATSLSNLALCHGALGQHAQALPLHLRSLAIREQALDPDHPDFATSLSNLALTYRAMGRYAQALPLSLRSVAILEKAHGADQPAVARGVNNLAALYESMGRYDEALAAYRRSLSIWEKVFDPEHPEVATGLGNLAGLYELTGEYQKALPLYERSLAIREKRLGSWHPDVAASLNNLAGFYQSTGRQAQAAPLYRRSLAILEKVYGDQHPALATSLNNLAVLQGSLGRYKQALPLLYRAEKIVASGDDPETAWRVQNSLRVVHTARRQPELGIFWGKQAINTLQHLRAGLACLDRQWQRSFLQDKRYAYTELADLLIREGRIPEAQQVMAMLKEEEYFDFVQRNASVDARTTEIPLTGVERVAHERFYAVRNNLAALASEQEQLNIRHKRGEASEADDARRNVLTLELSAARKAFDAFTVGLTTLLAGDAEQAKAVTAVQRQIQTHRTLLGTLGEAKQGVATVQFIAGERRLHIVLTTASVQLAHEVAIERDLLSRKITAFRELVQDPDSDPKLLGRELYGLLFAPLRADLEAQRVHTIMLFLDGALRYLPFGALVQDDGRYLVERYRLPIYTEAARSAVAQRPQQQWQIAAYGVTRGFPEQGFSALPAVRSELDSIVRPDVLPGQAYLDERFDLDTFESALDTPVVHVASHFHFVAGSNTSFLLLGDGTPLSLQDIAARDLRFDKVDLLTLSACETAVGGGRGENGLEVEGLGVLAQIQGAKAVLATLWPVADDSTGVLMRQFYWTRQDGLRHGHDMTKVEALRQAQMALLTGATGNSTSAATTAPYAHPYYWAPFILMGNWL